MEASPKKSRGVTFGTVEASPSPSEASPSCSPRPSQSRTSSLKSGIALLPPIGSRNGSTVAGENTTDEKSLNCASVSESHDVSVVEGEGAEFEDPLFVNPAAGALLEYHPWDALDDDADDDSSFEVSGQTAMADRIDRGQVTAQELLTTDYQMGVSGIGGNQLVGLTDCLHDNLVWQLSIDNEEELLDVFLMFGAHDPDDAGAKGKLPLNRNHFKAHYLGESWRETLMLRRSALPEELFQMAPASADDRASLAALKDEGLISFRSFASLVTIVKRTEGHRSKRHDTTLEERLMSAARDKWGPAYSKADLRGLVQYRLHTERMAEEEAARLEREAKMCRPKKSTLIYRSTRRYTVKGANKSISHSDSSGVKSDPLTITAGETPHRPTQPAGTTTMASLDASLSEVTPAAHARPSMASTIKSHDGNQSSSKRPPQRSRLYSWAPQVSSSLIVNDDDDEPITSQDILTRINTIQSPPKKINFGELPPDLDRMRREQFEYVKPRYLAPRKPKSEQPQTARDLVGPAISVRKPPDAPATSRTPSRRPFKVSVPKFHSGTKETVYEYYHHAELHQRSQPPVLRAPFVALSASPPQDEAQFELDANEDVPVSFNKMVRMFKEHSNNYTNLYINLRRQRHAEQQELKRSTSRTTSSSIGSDGGVKQRKNGQGLSAANSIPCPPSREATEPYSSATFSNPKRPVGAEEDFDF